jgi:pimeloyl-ACP methyl ester carboxylesterase
MEISIRSTDSLDYGEVMSVSEALVVVTRGGVRLIGERWSGPGPVVVLLHAGVTDRRSWHAVAAALDGRAAVVAYDRRGFGETAPSDGEGFSHVEDLIAVLDVVTDAPAWLVGSSAGAGVALDAAVSAPERVAGLVLLAPAVTGAPAPELDADTARFDRLLDQAMEAGDLDELNRLATWLWLDGPAQPEGRVGAPARSLLLDMNRIILANRVPEEVGASGVDAWSQLDRVDIAATVACGDLDVPFLVDRSSELAKRLPHGRHRVLAGMAHLPQIEDPAAVAALVDDAITAA